MDSKPTFGVLLVLIGLVGMWALVTGRLSKILAGSSTTTLFDPSSKLKANVVGGNSAPLGGSTIQQTSYMPLGSPAIAYGVVIGDGAARIEPIGAAAHG